MTKLLVVTITLALLMLSQQQLLAVTIEPDKDTLTAHDTLKDSVRNVVIENDYAAPEESFQKKKLITSILAFPVPFGFIGLHRIYLGTEPWVPVIYLCTGGGGAGLLPLIDFIFLVTADEEEFKKYENNPNLFMWME